MGARCNSIHSMAIYSRARLRGEVARSLIGLPPNRGQKIRTPPLLEWMRPLLAVTSAPGTDVLFPIWRNGTAFGESVATGQAGRHRAGP